MTNPEQSERVYAIFQQVLRCDPAGRAALLAELCTGDPDLRAKVERLLAVDEQASQEGFLSPPNPPASNADRDWRSPLGLRGLKVHVLCPHCQNPIGLVNLPVTDKDVVCPSCGSSFQLERESTAPWSLRKGQRWLGRFELIERAGLGAFGTVYKARDPQLDRTVAIKVPRVGNLATEEDRNRFLREGRSVARLQHEFIVPVHEVGEHDGVPYLVSDFVQGVSLSDLLTGRRPPPKEAARLVAEIADALQYAHEQGVIHRDVKPSNIMLDDKGEPRLMDFGLAKREVGEITMTIEGQVLGTPAYMSPEQARGQGHKVDGRSDVYSLGVVLYEVLTGELPFRGNQRMLLHQVLNDEPKPPRKLNDRIPRDLETICLKAMAKEPGRRYSTAAALATDLRRFLNEEPIQARPVGQLERSVKWLRRRPAVAATIGVSLTAAFTLLTGGTLFTLRLHRANAETTRANQDLIAANAKIKQRTLEAEAAAKKSRESLVRLATATGNYAAEAGDWWTALVGYHHAWELDQGPGEAAGHRQRMASILARCPRLLGICLHKDIVREAEFAPSGERIVTLAENSRAFLWNPHRNQYLAELRHEGEVHHATMDQAGERVATAGKDGIVRLWQAADGKPLVSLRHPAAVHWAAFSADGTSLATACADGFVRLWQTDIGAVRPVKIATGRPALFVVFSPDSSRLLTVDDSEKARVWNGATGELQSPLLPHRLQPGGVGIAAKVLPSFSPDGRWVVSVYNHGRSGPSFAYDQTSLHFWRAGTEFSTLPLNRALNQVVFSPDSNQVLALGASRTVWLLNVPENANAGSRTFETPREVQRGAFSPDGKLIATASSGGLVQFWDRSSLRPAGATRSGEHGMSLRHLADLTQLVFSSDGRYLLSAGHDGTARLWQLPPTEFVGQSYQFDCGRAHLSGPWLLDRAKGIGVTYSPDGQREIRFSLSGKTTIQQRPAGGSVIALNTEGPVLQAGFTADGQRAATLGKNEARIWSAQTGEAIGPGLKLDDPVEFRLDGHGQRLAVADSRGAVFLWDVDTGREMVEPFHAPIESRQALVPLHAVPRPKGSSIAKQTAIALSENGRYLAAASVFESRARPTVAVIDVETGSTVVIVLKKVSVIQSLELSRDGKHLLIASSDTSARIYESASGEPAGPPLHHPNFVRRAAFSWDGRYVVTADAVQNVRVWDGQTGELLVPPLPAKTPGEPLRVWFSKDDRRVILRSSLVKAIQWDLPVLEASIAPSPDLMGLLSGQQIDETEGMAFLDVNTLRDDPERFGKAWLSWVDGGLLDTLALRGDARPAGMPAPEAKGRELSGWGLAIDPDNDCQFHAEEKVLSLKVPGGWHDLLPDGSILNAPRVLRPVQGDFVFTVKVVGDFRPSGTSTIPGKPLYNAAGILIWNDSDNFIRLDRYAFVRDGKAIGNIALLVRNGGQLRPVQGEAFPQGTCYLRVQRKGNVIQGALSSDGRKWIELKPIDTSWPATLRVGLDGANSSSEPFSVNFNEVDLQARGAVPK